MRDMIEDVMLETVPTFQQLLEKGSEILAASGIEEAGTDAKYLLLETLHMDTAHYLVHRHECCTDRANTERYLDLIQRRADRIPLQYLIGYQEFMGLSFMVNPHVLIPRQDTETLVELVLQEHPDASESILDMCTGSGCIAVSLKKLGGYQKVTAADVSKEALEVAKKNAQANEVSITLVESDLFEAFAGLDLAEGGGYDIMVSNPPYIPTKVIETLIPEVRDYEPKLALDGTEDGLHYYRRLAAEARGYLKPGGSIYLEIGHDQGITVKEILCDAGYLAVRVIEDITGHDRVVAALR